ncbi:MAG: aryl-sulfate sulfotransferase [Bacteroidales bacterium]|nr:aryl-sulfate sulfotransferase [Bacteroidales bacterium]
MKIFSVKIIFLCLFILFIRTIKAEDDVIVLKTIQASDNVSIDSVFLVNKSNQTTTNLGGLSQSNSLYKINLTQGTVQIATNISETHVIDNFIIRQSKAGFELLSNTEQVGSIMLSAYGIDGKAIFSKRIPQLTGMNSTPFMLPTNGLFLVKVKGSYSSKTFKIVSDHSNSKITSYQSSNTKLRSTLNSFLYSTNDSIQITVKKGDLISPFWMGRPQNNDTISMILPTNDNLFSQPEIITQLSAVNPTGYVPLAARIQLTTTVPTRAEIKVFGINGVRSDVVKRFDELSTTHNLPVLGLYGAYSNIVQLTLFDSSNQIIGSSAITMQTNPLSIELPTVAIDTTTNQKKSGMTLVSYRAFLYNTANKPFIFDEYGDIRWYLDYGSNPTIIKLLYDVGIERLQNGNFYFGHSGTNTIYEINMLGEILNSWPISGYRFHHQALEKPNGNFLVNVDKNGLSTVEDHMIEIDRNTKQIVNIWDLRQSLQYNRRTLTNLNDDWIHTNAVEYDPTDSTIIVSGRTQGVVKLDAQNNVKWLLAPHKGWGIAGNGVDLTTKLLQPIDSNDQPILDTAVINGYTNHPDFEWNWCQHAIKRQPNGNFTIFDNGDVRNFTTQGPYSRAVEYKIDTMNMTVKQIWQYGKERGAETYSRIVSDVDFLNDVNHVIFSPGAIVNPRPYGKIIEIDYATKNVLFEATIHPPKAYNGVLTFHRIERLNLYPY